MNIWGKKKTYSEIVRKDSLIYPALVNFHNGIEVLWIRIMIFGADVG